MSINRERKYFDLSHLQELADCLIPIVIAERDSGRYHYKASDPIEMMKEDLSGEK